MTMETDLKQRLKIIPGWLSETDSQLETLLAQTFGQAVCFCTF